MRLSEHFTSEEMTATAVRGVDNTPSLEEDENLRFLCREVLEPVRIKFGPMYTTSGYRSDEVNRIIGGSKTSNHVYGLAWDGVPLRSHVKWADVVEHVLKIVPFVDQVIYEYGRWIHIGTRPKGEHCRREALMIFDKFYEPWNRADKRITR
jgi:zinc D-Ala-D-Ala carboxypeptidase